MPASGLETFAAFRYPNYRSLWIGTFFSAAGDWIQQLTLGWLIYDLTGSALLVGALGATRGGPFIIVGPISGVLSDRMDRRKLLMANQIFLAALALGLASVVSAGKVQAWHLFVFSILAGAGFAMNTPLRQALVANTVPQESMANAIALSSAAFNINRTVGPALGGLLITFFGPGANFFIQSGCYVLAAALVFMTRLDSRPPSVSRRPSPLADLRQGMSYVRNEPRTLSLILVSFVPSLFLMPFIGLMPVFSKDVLHRGPDGLGVLLSVIGVGSLVGTLAVATMGDRARNGSVQLAAGAMAGLALIGLSRSTSVPVAVPFLAAQGAMQMMFFAINSTMLQTITPDAVRGRVMSIYMLHLGVSPLGSLLAGTLAHYSGAPGAMLAGGALVAVVLLLAAARFRVLRGSAQPRPVQAG